MADCEVPASLRESIALMVPERVDAALKFYPNAGCYTDAVYIDDDLIGLFLRGDQRFSPQRTVDICDVIRNRISLSLPLAVARAEGALICERISGTPLYRVPLNRLQRVQFIECARGLGSFLAELQSIPIDELAHLDLMDRSKDHSVTVVDETVGRFITDVAPQLMYPAVEWLREHCMSMEDEELADWEPVLQHGELAPPHILFDFEAGHLSGIIDFGEVGIGDPADELFWLIWSYGQTFVDEVVAEQPSLMRHYRRARFLMGFHMIRWCLQGISGGPRSYGKLLTLPFDFNPLRRDE